MEQILVSSVERLQHASHVNGLLNKANFDVLIQCEGEKWLLVFKGNGVTLVTEFDATESVDVNIEGNKESLKLVFQGEDFLMSLKKRGDVSVNGKLKDLLLLESLWYLSKNSL